jgi:hypothetical protein
MEPVNFSYLLRKTWIENIFKANASFTDSFKDIQTALDRDYSQEGSKALLSHLHFCGVMPESIRPSSTEEKRYSKYTDAVLGKVFQHIGLESLVFAERADCADVDVVGKDYDFVADAKAFRLSRTAKNQKDFKVEAMAQWKREREYALVVAPSYQLPTRTSQIYEQSIRKHVAILSYSQLCILVRVADTCGTDMAQGLLHDLFKSLKQVHPSKDALFYWKNLNSTLLEASPVCDSLWLEEKQANYDALNYLKKEGLSYWDAQRKEIMLLSKEEAIQRLIEHSKIDSKVRTIQRVTSR